MRIPRLRGLFYGWWILVAGMAGSAAMIGVTIQSFGVFFNRIAEDLGVSRTALSLAYSFRSFESGILPPVVGFAIERFGPRRMALAGCGLFALGLFVISQSHALWLFYAGFLIVAMAQTVGGGSAYNAAIINWFQKKRARVVSIYSASFVSGLFFVYPAALLTSSFGWRPTVLIFLGVGLAMLVPAALVLRYRPEDYGYLPDGERPSSNPSVSVSEELSTRPLRGFTVKQAVRLPAFWMLVIGVGLYGMTASGIVLYQVPHMEASGYSTKTAGLIVMAYAVSNIMFRAVMVGLVIERFSKHLIYATAFLLKGAGLITFAYVAHPGLIPVYIILHGLGTSIGIVMNLSIIAELFGRAHYPSIQGLAHGIGVVFGVVGPLLGGIVFDATGSFQVAYFVYAAAAFIGAPIVFLAAGPLAPKHIPAAVPAGHRPA